MKPPYEISPLALNLISSISRKIGVLDVSFLVQSSPKLRKKNQVKTIHSSLKIEGNTLSENQISSLLEGKRVMGPSKDIIEVDNAIKVYQQLDKLSYDSMDSFLEAHNSLMASLIPEPGKFRKGAVGIVKGNDLAHLAPSAKQVPRLMNELFAYLKTGEHCIIKSCVFHYELEFIHPFDDGNGRMGRLWQTLILMDEYPVFKHIPFESIIARSQEEYYQALAKADKAGSSTIFIEYMLQVLDQALEELLDSSKQGNLDQELRLKHFRSLEIEQFSRKDYLTVFRQISVATASRDLKQGVDKGYFEKEGDKRLTIYRVLRN